MKKPPTVEGPVATTRWVATQAWSDLKSVYFANTPVWRWLKSGALVFLGLFVWAASAVLLSIRPAWTFLYLTTAYGFLLIFWGPLTHFIVVPLALRLRRTAEHPTVQLIARNTGKINLTIFFTLVLILAIVQPGFILLEFAPGIGDSTTEVRGTIECVGPDDSVITCEVRNSSGFDHAVVISGGEVIAHADEEPYRLEFSEDEVEDNRYLVQLRGEDGTNLRTVSYSI